MGNKSSRKSVTFKVFLFLLLNTAAVTAALLLSEKIRTNQPFHSREFIIITLSVFYPLIWSCILKICGYNISELIRPVVLFPFLISLSFSPSILSLFKIYIPLSVDISYLVIVSFISIPVFFLMEKIPEPECGIRRLLLVQSSFLMLAAVSFVISTKIISKLTSTFAVNRLDELFVAGGLFFFSIFLAKAFPSSLQNIFAAGRNILEKRLTRLILFIIYTAVPAITYFQVLDGMPHIQDEIAYFFQAKVFAAGKFFADSPPVSKFFDCEFIVIDGAKWYGKYFFGFPVLLAAGITLKIPWLINPLLGAGAVFLFCHILKKYYTEGNLHYYMLVVPLFSPFMIFINASYLSHTSSLFFLTLFLYLFIKSSESKSLPVSFLCGLSLGFAFNIRPFTAVTISAPFILYGLYLLIKKKIKFTQILIFSAGFVLFIGAYISYNHILTGNMFQTPFSKYCPTDRIGFGEDIGIPYLTEYGHNFADGWENTRANLKEFSSDILGFPKICFILVLVPFITGSATLFDKLFLSAFVLNMAGYFCYYFNGIAYGPRYYYETALFMLFLMVKGAVKLSTLIAEKLDGKNLSGNRENAYLVMPVILVLLLLQTCVSFIPGKIQSYGNRYWNLDKTLEHLIEKENISNAVVFIKSGYYRDGEAAPNYYGAGFINNSINLDGDIVYARDFGDKDDLDLMKHFPGRKPYRFVYNYSLITAHRYYKDNLEPFLYPIPKPEITNNSRFSILP